MATALLLTAAFVGPVDELDPTVHISASVDPQTYDELRAEYRRALSMTAKSSKLDPEVSAPQLLLLYRSTFTVEDVPHTERSRMRHGLEFRLKRVRNQLAMRVRDFKRTPSSIRTERTDDSNAELAGGATCQNAQALIDLIQNTIAPGQWNVNGGNGSIIFYPQLNVLVVRGTDHVHADLGGMLQQLRRAEQ